MPRTTSQTNLPPFVVDWTSISRDQGRQIDWDVIPASYQYGAQKIVVGSGGAAQNATSVPVAALPIALPAGTTLDFGGAKFARLTAAAAKGATSITVTALVTAVAANDFAWAGGQPGKKFLPAGTVVAPLSNGKVIPRAIVTGSETAQFILETDAREESVTAAKTGYGVIAGGYLFENVLPEATGSPKVINSTWKTELSGWFKFRQYGDNR